VRRLRGFATAAVPFAARDGDAPVDPDRPAIRLSPTAQWILWVAFLILPGSFLLLPVLIWARISPRRPRPDAAVLRSVRDAIQAD
jgi:hypothetical protein